MIHLLEQINLLGSEKFLLEGAVNSLYLSSKQALQKQE